MLDSILFTGMKDGSTFSSDCERQCHWLCILWYYCIHVTNIYDDYKKIDKRVCLFFIVYYFNKRYIKCKKSFVV